MISELEKTQQALAEALAFLPDAGNTAAPAVVAWHKKHAETIRATAKKFDREHLLTNRPDAQPVGRLVPLNFGSSSAIDICNAGWSLITHNDQAFLHGGAGTKWVFGRGETFLYGLGSSDREALDNVRDQLFRSIQIHLVMLR